MRGLLPHTCYLEGDMFFVACDGKLGSIHAQWYCCISHTCLLQLDEGCQRLACSLLTFVASRRPQALAVADGLGLQSRGGCSQREGCGASLPSLRVRSCRSAHHIQTSSVQVVETMHSTPRLKHERTPIQHLQFWQPHFGQLLTAHQDQNTLGGRAFNKLEVDSMRNLQVQLCCSQVKQQGSKNTSDVMLTLHSVTTHEHRIQMAWY